MLEKSVITDNNVKNGVGGGVAFVVSDPPSFVLTAHQFAFCECAEEFIVMSPAFRSVVSVCTCVYLAQVQMCCASAY